MLVPVQHHKELADAIIKLASDPLSIKNMRLESRTMVLEHFADDVVNHEMLAIYSNSNS